MAVALGGCNLFPTLDHDGSAAASAMDVAEGAGSGGVEGIERGLGSTDVAAMDVEEAGIRNADGAGAYVSGGSFMGGPMTLCKGVPEHWTPCEVCSATSDMMHVVPVHSSSEEYHTVASPFVGTGVDVKRVYRIQNAMLWRAYCNAGEELQWLKERELSCLKTATSSGTETMAVAGCPCSVCNGSWQTSGRQGVNEQVLFHASRNVFSVMWSGYDPRKARETGNFGAGVYFGDTPERCHMYAPLNGYKNRDGFLSHHEKRMISGGERCWSEKNLQIGEDEHVVLVNSVMLGEVMHMPTNTIDKSLREPPRFRCGRRSDSVSGSLSGRTEFVVYDRSRVYPQYFVIYGASEELQRETNVVLVQRLVLARQVAYGKGRFGGGSRAQSPIGVLCTVALKCAPSEEMKLLCNSFFNGSAARTSKDDLQVLVRVTNELAKETAGQKLLHDILSKFKSGGSMTSTSLPGRVPSFNTFSGLSSGSTGSSCPNSGLTGSGSFITAVGLKRKAAAMNPDVEVQCKRRRHSESHNSATAAWNPSSGELECLRRLRLDASNRSKELSGQDGSSLQGFSHLAGTLNSDQFKFRAHMRTGVVPADIMEIYSCLNAVPDMQSGMQLHPEVETVVIDVQPWRNGSIRACIDVCRAFAHAEGCSIAKHWLEWLVMAIKQVEPMNEESFSCAQRAVCFEGASEDSPSFVLEITRPSAHMTVMRLLRCARGIVHDVGAPRPLSSLAPAPLEGDGCAIPCLLSWLPVDSAAWIDVRSLGVKDLARSCSSVIGWRDCLSKCSSAPPAGTMCPVMMENLCEVPLREVVQLKTCGHYLHVDAVDGLSANGYLVCPICKETYGTRVGEHDYSSKPGNVMWIKAVAGAVCPGVAGVGVWHILYVVQEEPGVYDRLERSAYLPMNVEGSMVLSKLIVAWMRNLTFSVGTSLTTGREKQLRWTLHHKTALSGGIEKYAYPDDEYLGRVSLELESLGVKALPMHPS